MLPDSEYAGLRNVVAGLLGLQLTNNDEVTTSKNIDTNMSTGSGGTGANYDDEPDVSVVEKRHIDDSSISSNGSGEFSLIQMMKQQVI